MRPKLELLDRALVERILGEAFQLIEDPGVRVAPYVVDLLRSAGVTVEDGVAHIPEALARWMVELAPRRILPLRPHGEACSALRGR